MKCGQDNCFECPYPDCDPKYWNKPEGIPIEIADAVIRIADMCGKYGIDLEDAIKTKQAYNQNRSYRHGGKVC